MGRQGKWHYTLRMGWGCETMTPLEKQVAHRLRDHFRDYESTEQQLIIYSKGTLIYDLTVLSVSVDNVIMEINEAIVIPALDFIDRVVRKVKR